MGRKEIRTDENGITYEYTPGLFGPKKPSQPPPPPKDVQLGFEYRVDKNALRLARTEQARINKAIADQRKADAAAERSRRQIEKKARDDAKKAEKAARKAAGELNAYQAVMARRRAIEDNQMQVGRHEYETDNGGLQYLDVDRGGSTASNIGEPGGRLARHKRPNPVPIPPMTAQMKGVEKGLQTEADRWRQAHHPEASSNDSAPAGVSHYRINDDALPGTTERGVRWPNIKKILQVVGVLPPDDDGSGSTAG